MFSLNDKYLGIISENAQSISIFAIEDFTLLSSIKAFAHITSFTWLSSYLLQACTEDGFVKQFSIANGKILKKSSKLVNPIT